MIIELIDICGTIDLMIFLLLIYQLWDTSI